MNNKDFANILAIALKNGKISECKLVSNFIETYEGDASVKNINTKVEDATPEIIQFVTKLRNRRIKVKDHQLMDLICEIESLSPEPEITTTDGDYQAEEW